MMHAMMRFEQGAVSVIVDRKLTEMGRQRETEGTAGKLV
jgi:hypothetical protein